MKMKRKTLKAKETLYHMDEAIVGLWRIESGVILQQKLTASGQVQILDILGPGDFVELSPTGRHNHEATAFTDATLTCRQFAELNEAERKELLDQALQRVSHYQEQSVCIAREQANDRVKRLIALLAHKSEALCESKDSSSRTVHRNFLLTRQQMADYTGLTLETVSRVLSNWKRSGVLQERRGQELRVNGAVFSEPWHSPAL